MNQKYPIKAFDGTNTTDVQVLNVPAESVGENGEVNLDALLTQTVTANVDFNVSDAQDLLPAVPTGKIRIPIGATLRGADISAADSGLNIGWDNDTSGFGFSNTSLANLADATSFISTQYASIAPAEAESFKFGTAGQVLQAGYNGTPLAAVAKLDITYIDRDA